MADDEAVSIPRKTLLRNCPEQQAGIALPAPINTLLDVLVQLADEGGMPTNRKELVATLILFAKTEPKELADLVGDYRRFDAGHAVVAPRFKEQILTVRRPPRGPRRRQRASFGAGTAPVAD